VSPEPFPDPLAGPEEPTGELAVAGAADGLVRREETGSDGRRLTRYRSTRSAPEDGDGGHRTGDD